MTHPPNHLKVRRLLPSDVGFIEQLRALAGWNQTREDLLCLIDYEPEGCFLAEWDGTSAGVATTTSFGTDLAWIGMMLVHPEFRRRGIGTELMRRCVDHLERKGIRCIKLDASDAGKPVYERLDFQAEYKVQRWEREGDGSSINGFSTDNEFLDFDLDTRTFGADRSRLLCSFAKRSRIVTRLSSSNTLAGYGMIRPGDRAAYVGPIVACDSGTGVSVAAELIERETAKLFWDIPLVCHEAVSFAESSGFRCVRSLTRMWRGADLVVGQPQLQFGIGDLATG